MLVGDPNVFVYTSTDNDNTLALLEDLGFTHQYTAFAYGWDCTKGHLYSVPKYFNMVTTNRSEFIRASVKERIRKEKERLMAEGYLKEKNLNE